MKSALSKKALGHESEYTLHKRVVKYLTLLQKTKPFIFFHVKNSDGARFRQGKGHFYFDFSSLGVLSGVPDFVIMLPDAKMNFLELKTVRGRLSQNQKKFKQEAEDLGYTVFVSKGWENTVEIIDSIFLEEPNV